MTAPLTGRPITPFGRLSEADFWFAVASLARFCGSYPNSADLAETLGVTPPAPGIEADDNFRAGIEDVLARAGLATPQAFAAHIEGPVPFVASRTQVACYETRWGCHAIVDDRRQRWCEVHGTYYDHQAWTVRGCPEAAEAADMAVWVATR